MTAKILKQNIIEVNDKIIARIKALAENHIYTVDSHLYYEGQTPIVAYLLVAGDVNLIKSRRKSIPVEEGCIFGLYELICCKDSVYGAHIKGGSEVYFINRSLLKEIIDLEADQDLKRIFENLLLEIA